MKLFKISKPKISAGTPVISSLVKKVGAKITYKLDVFFFIILSFIYRMPGQ